MNPYHAPVLLDPILHAAVDATRVVDGTLGDGGHAEALARMPGVELLGIDRDPDAIAVARDRLGPSVRFVTARYDEATTLETIRTFEPDFILLDLGVSSRQLDEADRGFTFRPGASLDMRMGGDGESAADFLNAAPVGDLERVFKDFGDERHARRLAKAIHRRRQTKPFAVSDDLVNAIRGVLGPRSGPAEFARIFQAVRIEVNHELAGLERALPQLRDALIPGGCLAVISYHSGEDRQVKRAFQSWAKRCVCPPHQPVCTCRGRPLGRMSPRKPITPEESEVAANPRARSAKLRLFQSASDEA